MTGMCAFRMALCINSGNPRRLTERPFEGGNLRELYILPAKSTTPRLDLPGFCGERLPHFPGLSLDGYGALEAER